MRDHFKNAAQRLDAIRVQVIDLSEAMVAECWSCKICKAKGEYPGFTHKSTCPVAPLGRDWKPPTFP